MSSMLARALRNACCFTILLLFGWVGAAKAESIVYSDTVPSTFVGLPLSAFTFPQFDPSIGILTNVQITLTGDISGTAGYENLLPAVVPVDAQVIANLRQNLPNGGALNAGGTLLTVNESAGAFDGVRDYGGTSGKTFPFDNKVSNAGSYFTPTELAHYIGIDTITLPATASSSWNAGGGSANVDVSIQTKTSVHRIVNYVYLIPQIVLKKFTNGFDADHPNDADVPQIRPGDPITWTYLLTNTGAITIPLATIVVTDSQPGVTPIRVPASDVNNDSLLSPGEVWLYRATGIAQNLEAPTGNITVVSGCNPGGTTAPGNRATYQNIGQVTAPGATAADPSHYCNPPNPGIVIKKLTNGFDANDANGADVPQIQPGAPVTWTYIVTNTGNITFAFTNVNVMDNQPGVTPVWVASSDMGNDQLLSPGEVWLYRAHGTAQDLKAPSAGVTTEMGCNPNDTTVPGARPAYFNIGQVTVPGATASDPSHYCNPPVAGISLQKTVYKSHNQGGFCPGGELVVDAQTSPVTYCFEIINTGETYLSDITLIDADLGIALSNMTLLSGAIPLAPGAKLRYFYETTLQKNLINLAKVKGHPTDNTGRTIPGLSDLTAQDSAEVQLLPTAIDLLYVSLIRNNDQAKITWATLPSHDTAGYYLYRSATEQRSDALRLNNQLLVGVIENKGEAGTIVTYTFNEATSSASDFDRLVEVKVDGSTNESGPFHAKLQNLGQSYRIFLPQIQR